MSQKGHYAPYPQATTCLSDALEKVAGNDRKKFQISGNLGRIQVHTGQWAEAEAALTSAIAYDEEHHEEFSLAVNVLSLGYLHLRRRHFAQATKCFERAKVVIAKNDYKRLHVIALEYLGELALEREDNYRAKSILSDAYQKSLLMAPGSALVSQSARRLAEAEFALDNASESMKYGQKALEISTSLGERADLKALPRSSQARALQFLGIIQLAGAASLGEGRITLRKLHIFLDCLSGAIIREDPVNTRVARLLFGESFEVSRTRAKIAKDQLSGLTPRDNEILVSMINSVSILGWHSLVRRSRAGGIVSRKATLLLLSLAKLWDKQQVRSQFLIVDKSITPKIILSKAAEGNSICVTHLQLLSGKRALVVSAHNST